MKFPYSMLRDFVDTRLSAEEIGDLLTMAGFELEGIEEVEGDSVLDIKVMSNRGDGLSVYGLAREVLAKDPDATATELYRAAASRFTAETPSESLEIGTDAATIEAPECRRFACRAFRGVPGHSSSPEWMQLRLRQAGMRPISLLVDLTNYVMLELGQPLHAFDRQKLAGQRIVVRHARPGEKLTTLNGEEHELSGQMMICDAEKPVGVPGVMGGLETEVTDATTELLLESANFLNTTVRKTRKQLGLSTEASYRFERSVDPDGVVAAIKRFTQLLQESIPSVEVSSIVDHYPGKEDRAPIAVRTERSNRLLGMEISTELSEDYLRRLGMDVTRAGEALEVKPPSWRPDIVREDDLIEEIGRVHGYDKIPELLPQGTTTQGGPQGYELWQDMAIEAVIRAGFVQCISHSLRDLHPLDADGERIGPRNPGSPEMAWLRNSILPSLADAARRNNAKEAHLFERGRVFAKGHPYHESTSLGLLSVGPLRNTEWTAKESNSASFFTLKGALEEICTALGIEATFKPSSDPRLHPTRQALLTSRIGPIGLIGQIHPDIASEADLSEETLLAEIDLPAAYESRRDATPLRAVSRFPSVRRDISIQLSKDVPYERVEDAVKSAITEALERVWLFDVYAGKGIPEGSHSLAIALQLRKPDGTFTDEEANLVRELAVEALEALGGTRR
ncbi:MAG TPA: phenylalanine--tRNA ligase subunit beta [Fimbriimonas sp.]|nr:phenylalanine--tRNA ligase subunit beta [Fimbriimonas sp.]